MLLPQLELSLLCIKQGFEQRIAFNFRKINKFPDLPKDVGTLFEMPLEDMDIQPLYDGYFLHIGIKDSVAE